MMIINKIPARTLPFIAPVPLKHSAVFTWSPQLKSDLTSILNKALKKGPLYTSSTKIIYFYRSDDAFIDFRKDYYQILGLSQSATHQEIKQQFYLLAKEHHPDKASGNESYFKEINEAYKVLSQPKLKEEYDAHRSSSSQSNPEHEESIHQHKPLNYEPYSQMSRAEWSYYRRGSMKHCKTDYTNYEKTFDPQKNLQLDLKNEEQWNRAFRNITIQQVREQNQFRQKMFRKYVADKQRRKQEREQFLQKRLHDLGNRVQRFLGKGIRRLFDKLIKK